MIATGSSGWCRYGGGAAAGAEDEASVSGATLARWLASLGVPVARPEELERGFRGPATEFADGVRLAAVVDACENARGNREPLQGIERCPRGAAAAVANLRQALAALRRVPAMPLELLYSEARLRLGEARATRRLLLQVRRAYGHHLPSFFHGTVPAHAHAHAHLTTAAAAPHPSA